MIEDVEKSREELLKWMHLIQMLEVNILESTHTHTHTIFQGKNYQKRSIYWKVRYERILKKIYTSSPITLKL